MTRTISVEISPELLEAAQKALSTTTTKDTIEAAFQEVLRRHARQEEVEAFAAMDGMDLGDSAVMANAWPAR